MKILFLIFLFISSCFAIKPIALQYTGIKVNHKYSNEKKEDYIIERVINSRCLNIAISPESFNDLKNIDKSCKKPL